MLPRHSKPTVNTSTDISVSAPINGPIRQTKNDCVILLSPDDVRLHHSLVRGRRSTWYGVTEVLNNIEMTWNIHLHSFYYPSINVCISTLKQLRIS